jgi:hypothetical protein
MDVILSYVCFDGLDSIVTVKITHGDWKDIGSLVDELKCLYIN